MQSPQVQDLNRPSQSIPMRLKFYFAALTFLGGMVLSAGTENSTIPMIAVFFAFFGFVFVDWLELFALPPIAAYAAMAVVALMNVSDFLETDAPGNHQMVAVARLLVFVQAILMLQRKTVRIFEQLSVFCLLELVVAAVFNDAISYGLLLIPIGILGALSLSRLSTLSTTEGLNKADDLEHAASMSAQESKSNRIIMVSSPDSCRSIDAVANRLPRIALMTLAPAVLLIGLAFFYTLPRTTAATHVQNRGNALTGFSEDLELNQIGQMMRSPTTALRFYLHDRSTSKPYPLVGGVYLRGKVLERYRIQSKGARMTAIWNAAPSGMLSDPKQLPVEYLPERSSDQNFYDVVDVTVICESMRSSALFAIAPYHQWQMDADVIHIPEWWTLKRADEEDWIYPRIQYHFGTHAFRSGIQVDLINYRGQGAPIFGGLRINRLDTKYRQLQQAADERRYDTYLRELLEFDKEAMPTAAELAKTFVTNASGTRRSDFEIAKAMERHFLASGQYEYTLNLDADPVPGLDPIEQFLRIDKRGHCQYYASALAMMLRSQGIPARLVVGYLTDEYNELGNHYVARQLHAHAWVETLISQDQLSGNPIVYGQPPSESYWLRLDPTPAAGRAREVARSRGMGQVFDVAKSIWDDYVVDMDAKRQRGSLPGSGTNTMTGAYEQYLNQLSMLLSRLQAGELGGGKLAWRSFLSWPLLIAGCLLVVIIASAMLLLRVPLRLRRKWRGSTLADINQPAIKFYAEVLRQLERLDITRQTSQTPAELATAAEDRFAQHGAQAIAAPLWFLTSLFYQSRFGPSSIRPDLENTPSIEHAHQPHADTAPVGVEQALDELTRGVDSILSQQNNAEQIT